MITRFLRSTTIRTCRNASHELSFFRQRGHFMKVTNHHKAKTALSALLAEVEKTGENVLVCRHGKPVAALVSHRAHSRLRPQPVIRKIRLRCDPITPLARG